MWTVRLTGAVPLSSSGGSAAPSPAPPHLLVLICSFASSPLLAYPHPPTVPQSDSSPAGGGAAR